MENLELTHINSLFDLSDFDLAPGVIHLAASGESPFLRQHMQAFTDYSIDKGRGWPGRLAQEERVESARSRAARIFGVPREEIGFVSNVAEGMSILSESINWRVGDNVCIDAVDFPSVVLPFGRSKKLSVELRIAEGDDPCRFSAIVESNTRVIAVSSVSYLTGERHDLGLVRKLADSSGAILAVDFSQSAGVLPTSASIADFAFSACYKFLLGCTGVAIAYWNRERQPDWAPSTAGWYSVELSQQHPDYRLFAPLKGDASRFSRGNVSYPSIYVLDRALEYLSTVSETVISKQVSILADTFLAGLGSLNIEPMTPRVRSRRGPSICFASREAQDLVCRLGDRSVVAFNGGGRVRVSFHGYNNSTDVSKAIGILGEEWRG